MPQKQQVTLRDVPFSDSYRATYSALDDTLLTRCRNIAAHVAEVFRHVTVSYENLPKKGSSDMQYLLSGAKVKAKIIAGLTALLTDGDNFRAYFDLLSPSEKLLFKYLYNHFYATLHDLKRHTGEAWATSNRFVWKDDFKWTHQVCNWLGVAMTPCCHSDSAEDRVVYLPSVLWQAYAKHIVAPQRNAGLDELPDELRLSVYSNERGAGPMLLTLRQMKEQGLLSNAKTRMTVALLRSVAKTAHVPEFFPDAKDKTNTLAAALAVPVVACYYNTKRPETPKYWTTLRDIINRRPPEEFLHVALSHLKGFRRDMIQQETKAGNLALITASALNSLKPGRWYTVSEIVADMMSGQYPMDELAVVTPTLLSSRKLQYTKSGLAVDYKETYEAFTMPIVETTLALLAVLGAVDIAYDPQSTPGDHRYDFIRFVRLTALGAYASYQSESYEGQGTVVHASTDYFALDAQRLIIRATYINGINPYEGIVTRFAEPIGGRRYRVTPTSFLKGCTTASDVENRVLQLRETVCHEPPAVWQQFFDEMKRRCITLATPGRQYIMRRIPPEATDLMRAIVANRNIREHTILAEGHIVIIKRQWYEEFREQLRREGFLV